MVDLGTYKDKFSDSGKRIFEHAVRESRSRDQNYIAVEHVINALIFDPARNARCKSVFYTHLTLPTICKILIDDCGVRPLN